jgi:hypothetical protein
MMRAVFIAVAPSLAAATEAHSPHKANTNTKR